MNTTIIQSSPSKLKEFFRFIKLLLTENGRSVLLASYPGNADYHQVQGVHQIQQEQHEASAEVNKSVEQHMQKTAFTGNYLAGAQGMLNPGLFK